MRFRIEKKSQTEWRVRVTSPTHYITLLKTDDPKVADSAVRNLRECAAVAETSLRDRMDPFAVYSDVVLGLTYGEDSVIPPECSDEDVDHITGIAMVITNLTMLHIGRQAPPKIQQAAEAYGHFSILTLRKYALILTTVPNTVHFDLESPSES